MGLTDFAYENFVSQGMSTLTAFSTQPVGPDYPEHHEWLVKFTLNTIFTMNAPVAKRALAFALLRRASGAVEHFDHACAETASLVSGQRSIAIYFRALLQFEFAIAQAYQGLEFLRQASGQPLFKKGDGSVLQRMNDVYNVSRHGDPQALLPGHIQLAWLERDGIHVTSSTLGLEELREVVADLARAGDDIASGRPFQ